jgi:putative (di)nucleoside polyphosphate hydrolase
MPISPLVSRPDRSQMGAMDLTTLRPNVGIVLVAPTGKVWLGRRARTAGPLNWQFPQGGIDEGEGNLDAALRELKEETGVTSVRLLARTRDWIGYVFPPDHHGAKLNRGWRGQKQLWFALGFTGEDSEVDLKAHGEAEFDAWRWVELEESLESVVAFKRETYQQVVHAFAPLIDKVRERGF